MNGKIVIIEGSDGSGKQTQSEKLYQFLKEENEKVEKISFPNYESDSSALVKMYLNGEFGENVEEINAYTASLFFSVDRIATYMKHFKKYYEKGYIIVSDRYTTSNMVHQASKISDLTERDNYLNWLEDIEYVKMKLPKPDLVIYLNVPYEFTKKNMENRENKITGDLKKDIHERNEEYLKNTYLNSLEIAKKMNWTIIDCIKDNKMKTIDEIHREIVMKINVLREK